MRDTVSFSQDTFHATISLPCLPDLPVKNVRKIFSIMLWDNRVNVQAIQDTELYIRARNDELTRAVKESKAQYERWVRIQALWEDTKHRLNYK